MITPADVRRAEWVIDTSGIVTILDEGVDRDRRGRKSNTTSLRLLLIGELLGISSSGQGAISSGYSILTQDLAIDDQIRLGVRTRRGGAIRVLKIKELYYQANRLNQHLAYGHGSAPLIDDAERERRHQVVMRASNALMDVFDLGWQSGVFAMDATGIWSWAKGGRKAKVHGAGAGASVPDDDLGAETLQLLEEAQRTGKVPQAGSRSVKASKKRKPGEAVSAAADANADPDVADPTEPMDAAMPDHDPLAEVMSVSVGEGASKDPDADWGIKTSKSGKTEVFFGYHEHTLVQVPDVGTNKDTEPRLIRRLELTPASMDVVNVSLRMLDSCPTPVRHLLVDMHYSYKKLSRWLNELTVRGISQHHDMRTTDQGFTEYNRMRFASGWAHCPATPDGLGVITRPGPFATQEQREAFSAEIDKRRAYRMRRVNQPDANGATRYQCPALAGTVGCPLRAGTDQTMLRLGQPIIERPPDEARDSEPLPACCTQQTVKVTPPEKIRKLAQPLYWGSKEWARMFSMRTYVEGSYGNRKNPSTENMRRGMFRSTGLVWVNLTVALAATSYNMRILRNWQERTGLGDPGHPLLSPDPEMFGFAFLTKEQAELIDARTLACDDEAKEEEEEEEEEKAA
jgi:hypothetical protein